MNLSDRKLFYFVQVVYHFPAEHTTLVEYAQSFSNNWSNHNFIINKKQKHILCIHKNAVAWQKALMLSHVTY